MVSQDKKYKKYVSQFEEDIKVLRKNIQLIF